MASIIIIKYLKTIFRIKHLYDYIFFIKYMLYKNAHDRTLFIFLNVIIFLKIPCANLDAAPISPLLPYGIICTKILIGICFYLFFRARWIRKHLGRSTASKH